MELKSRCKQAHQRVTVKRADEVCPALVCVSQAMNVDQADHYQPSQFQIQEHCTKGRHIRCPLQRPACIAKR
jgi:hypothetical protein